MSDEYVNAGTWYICTTQTCFTKHIIRTLVIADNGDAMVILASGGTCRVDFFNLVILSKIIKMFKFCTLSIKKIIKIYFV